MVLTGTVGIVSLSIFDCSFTLQRSVKWQVVGRFGTAYWPVEQPCVDLVEAVPHVYGLVSLRRASGAAMHRIGVL